MVGELKYCIPSGQYIGLTSKECMTCLTNKTDPFVSSAASSDAETDAIVKELKTTGNGLHDLRRYPAPCNIQIKSKKMDDRRRAQDTILLGACSGSGKIQSPKIEQWLSETFVDKEDASVARHEMYSYYCECCEMNNELPCNQASFGKIVRIVFPNIQTRRFGVRGHSRYHYFGIAPVQNQGRFSVTEHKRVRFSFECPTIPQEEQYSYIKPYLRGFPTVQNLPVGIKCKILAGDFLKMYESHAISLINAVVNADFDEVPSLISEFWTCFPARMFPLLNLPEFLTIIEECDRAIYFVINDVLIPRIPDILNRRLSEKIIEFLGSIPDCLVHNLYILPEVVSTKMLLVCKEFHRCMMNQLQINYLYTVTSVFLRHPTIVSRMKTDWEELSRSDIFGRITSVVPDIGSLHIKYYMCKVQSILSCHGNIPDQLLMMVDGCLHQFWHSTESKKPEVRDFVLYWNYIGGQIVQTMAELNSPLTGVFSLLEVLCKDYLLFKIAQQVDM